MTIVSLAWSYEMYCWLFNVKNTDLKERKSKESAKNIVIMKILQFLHFARTHAHHENHAVFVSNKLMLRWQLYNTVFIS